MAHFPGVPFPSELTTNVALAVGLGLSVALLLWLLRGYAPVRRIRLSALGLAALVGLYWVLLGLGLPADSTPQRIVVSLAVLVGANAILQLLDLLFWDYLLAARRHITVPRLIVDVFNFLVLGLVALGLLNRVFGIELSALLVTSTVVSAVIGLALQDTLANVISGLALQIERPFMVGDWVRVSSEEGQVTQMNWRTLTLRTRDNHYVILPNITASKEVLINFSRPTPLQRVRASIGVAYPHPPGQVKDVLIRAVSDAPGVEREPAPQAMTVAYGDFAVQYDILYWITDFARTREIHDAVMSRLWYALRRAGMTIPFPIRDVTVRTLADDHEARAQAQQRLRMFQELRRVSLFLPLTDAQVEQLARGAARARYYPGEALVRQGEAGDSLFVVMDGRVRVEVLDGSGAAAAVATLGPDEFFGEMSLLTGEPRSASVVAETEAEVAVVDKPDLAAVIEADARIPEALSLALEARTRNAAERRAAGTGPLSQKPDLQQAALVRRIRRFFGIQKAD